MLESERNKKEVKVIKFYEMNSQIIAHIIEHKWHEIMVENGGNNERVEIQNLIIISLSNI